MLTLFKTRTCAYCPVVAKYLKAKGAQFIEVYVDDDPQVRQELFNKTGMRTVPVTTDGQSYVVGLDYKRLAQLV